MNPKNPNNLTTEQIKQGYSTIAGAYDPVTGNLKTPQPLNSVITPKSLETQPKIQLPQTQLPTQPTPVANLTTGLLSQYDLNQKETQAKGFQDTGMEQYLKDIIGLQGETQAKAEELGKTDFAKNRAELVGVENRFRQLEAEKAQDDVTLVANMRAEERRDTLLPFAQMGQAKLAGDAQIVRALKTSEQNMLNSRSLALQGNMDLAKQTAEDAVAIKYAPYKDRIKSYEDIVKALEPYLTSAEKKESAKQLMKGNLVLKEIEKEETKEKEISKMIIEATPNAPTNIVANAKAIADKGGSSLEVAQALGQYGGDYLKTQLLKQQIETEKAQRSNYLASAAKTRTETSLLGQPVGVDGVIATLPKSSQERYYKLQGDFDQATKNYRGAIDSASSITALSKDATPQQQTAIIFQYMKTLDPSSTVREGEFALVGATAGLGDRAVNALKRLDNGSRLNEAQIKDIVGATKILADNAKKNLDATSNEYDRRAVKFGLPKGLFYEKQDTQPESNPFSMSLGVTNQTIPGTSIIKDMSNGIINFNIPTN
jgi:hypothetical protein